MANIETLGVNAVERLISRTDYLEPFLNKNDKEPSWDGYINAYNHAGNHPKSDMAGRVAVQVKGHSCVDIKREKKSFAVDMADIKNYLQEGGTIFFVVFITEDDEVVYYCNLLPYDLRKIIKSYGKQSSYTIHLKPFPQNKKEIADLVLNFIRNRDKQKTAISSELVTIAQLKEDGCLKSLSFGYTTVSKESYPMDYLFNNDIYVYADISYGITIPVQHIEQIEEAVAEISNDVYVGNRFFYHKYKVVCRKDVVELYFGKSVKFTYKKSKGNGCCNFKLQGTLSERITDEEFFISALKEGGVIINGEYVPLFKTLLVNFDTIITVRWLEHLDSLKKAKSVLDEMHVKNELDCDNMNAHDEYNLQRLVAAVYDKNLIPLKDIGSPIGTYKMANLTLLVCALKDVESGLFRLYDFLDAPLIYKGIDDDEKEFDSSICVELNADSFLNYHNIDYDAIMKNLEAVTFSKAYGNQLIYMLLEVLKAYDSLKLPVHPLLTFAKKIQELIQKNAVNMDKYVIEVNRLQIVKRERPLNDQEIQRLRKMVENPLVQNNVSLMTGIYLLLDDQLNAKNYYNKLEKNKREEFDEYPICRFIKWEE